MCLALLACNTHRRYRLIIAANRDEFYRRPSAPAAFWDEAPRVLAGRDLEKGGTWLGVTGSGRFALVTNYREGGSNRTDARSRGALVSQFLVGSESPQNYVARIAARDSEYNGFNLIAGDTHAILYHSNRSRETRTLADGVYGLSNHLLDTPWPKVKRGKETLWSLLEREENQLVAGLFHMLADHSRPGDEHLPSTGVSVEWERLLSSAFIASEDYGTRSSTVVLMDRDGGGRFVERTFGPGGVPEGEVSYRF